VPLGKKTPTPLVVAELVVDAVELNWEDWTVDNKTRAEGRRRTKRLNQCVVHKAKQTQTLGYLTQSNIKGTILALLSMMTATGRTRATVKGADFTISLRLALAAVLSPGEPPNTDRRNGVK
jgi:membrane carboxypeptidase/penicillin-binding protein